MSYRVSGDRAIALFTNWCKTAHDRQLAPMIRLGTQAIENDPIAIGIADNGAGITESVPAQYLSVNNLSLRGGEWDRQK